MGKKQTGLLFVLEHEAGTQQTQTAGGWHTTNTNRWDSLAFDQYQRGVDSEYRYIYTLYSQWVDHSILWSLGWLLSPCVLHQPVEGTKQSKVKVHRASHTTAVKWEIPTSCEQGLHTKHHRLVNRVFTQKTNVLWTGSSHKIPTSCGHGLHTKDKKKRKKKIMFCGQGIHQKNMFCGQGIHQKNII